MSSEIPRPENPEPTRPTSGVADRRSGAGALRPDALRPGGPAGRRRPRRALVCGVALAAVLSLGAAGCGGSDADDDSVVRKVVTTDAGTTIVRTITDRDKLKLEAQDSSLYAEEGPDTPRSATAAMEGKPLGARCKLKDGRTIGTIQLLWREDSRTWGSSLEVQGVYEEKEPVANVLVSCELRRGEPAGPGATDINAGPVTDTASFVDE
jgi:hypothetical protein